jgi:hypothetical protein
MMPFERQVLIFNDRDDAVRVDVIRAARSEVGAALAVGHHVVGASERPAVFEGVGQRAALWIHHGDGRKFGTTRRERPRRIGARALRGEQAALSVHRHGTRTEAVLHEHVLFAVGVQSANRVGLLLGEQHAAVSGADDPVRGFEIRPNQLPLRVRGDHAGNGGHGRGSLTREE